MIFLCKIRIKQSLALSRASLLRSTGGGGVNPLNSVQYCIFLYWFSRACYEMEELSLADCVYYLNRMLNAVDLYYEIQLPRIWSCEHPLGSIMGRASYADGLMFYQGCTVGQSQGGAPVLGENVTLYANAVVLGASIVGRNCIIAANSFVLDTNIPDDTIVFGQYPNLVFKSR